MIELYSIGIKIAVENLVSPQLIKITEQVRKLNAEVLRLRRALGGVGNETAGIKSAGNALHSIGTSATFAARNLSTFNARINTASTVAQHGTPHLSRYSSHIASIGTAANAASTGIAAAVASNATLGNSLGRVSDNAIATRIQMERMTAAVSAARSVAGKPLVVRPGVPIPLAPAHSAPALGAPPLVRPGAPAAPVAPAPAAAGGRMGHAYIGASGRGIHTSAGMSLGGDAVVGGMMAAGAGAIGMHAIGAAYSADRDYEAALMRMQSLNLGSVTNKRADKSARESHLYGVSPLEHIKVLSESVGLFGDYAEAAKYAPKILQLAKANQAIFQGKIGGELDEKGMMGVIKFIDRRGGFKDEASFERNLNLAERLMTGSGGRIKYGDLDTFSQRGGTAFRSLSDDGVMGMAGAMIEQGGSAAGVSMMSTYQNLIAGRTPKKTMALLEELGIGTLEYQTHATVGGKPMKSLVMTGIKDSELMQSNPREWYAKTLIPLLEGRGITDDAKIAKVINDMLSNRTASNQGSIMTTQRVQMLRDYNLTQNAMGADKVLSIFRGSAAGAEANLHAAWEGFLVSVGKNVVPVVIPALVGLADSLNTLGDGVRKNQAIAKTLVVSLGALAAVLMAGGTLVTAVAVSRIAFGGLGGMISGAGAAAARLAGGGALSTITTGLIGLSAAATALAATVGLFAGWKVGGAIAEGVDGSIAKGSGYETSSLRDWLDKSKLGRATEWFKYGKDEALNFQPAPSAAASASSARPSAPPGKNTLTGARPAGASTAPQSRPSIFGSPAAQRQPAGGMTFDTVRPPPPQPIHVNVVNRLDAHGLTTLVTRGQVAAVGSAALGTFSFDSSMAMPSITGGR